MDTLEGLLTPVESEFALSIYVDAARIISEI